MDNSPGRLQLDQNRRNIIGGLSTSDGETILPAEVFTADNGILVHIAGGAIVNPLVSAPLVGQAIIANTGTAVRLNGGTSQVLTNGLIITAPASNNAVGLTIGTVGVTNTVNGTGNGYILAPGASVSFAISNTNEIYINGTTGDIASWAGS